MQCPELLELLLTILPWFVLLVVLNAVEIVLLINLWGRLRSHRDTVMETVPKPLAPTGEGRGCSPY
jgi:hypothetical protein